VLYMLIPIARLCLELPTLPTMEEYNGGSTLVRPSFYAETILDLMTREEDPQGREKILISVGLLPTLQM